MRCLRAWFFRLAGLFNKQRRDRDFAAELQSHLQMHIEDNLNAGMNPEEAQRQAMIKLGGIEQTKERYRDRRGLPWLDALLQDLRYGLRQLRRNPGFTAVTVITLALGIGASTAIFSVVDAVLLRPLSYPHPGQIVRVWEAREGYRMQLADPNFNDFRAQNHTLSALAEYADLPLSVAGGSEPVRVPVALVSRDFFKAIGVQPFLGRWFSRAEMQLNGARATIVSYRYWQTYLGGSSDLAKFHLAMNGGVYPVVGVMPRTFDFPAGAALWVAREREFPESTGRTGHSWNCIGRVRKGFTVAQARADLDSIARRIHALLCTEKSNCLTGATVIPLSDAVVGDVRAALLTLFGVVILFFLVACANVAGLLLARILARRKELAVRSALGAGRARLAGQLLAESLVLAFAGGLVGILLAVWVTKLLPAMLPADLPRQQGIAVNAPVLLFTLIATLVVALGLGLFAAWRGGGVNLNDALNAGSRGYSGRSQRMRSALVVGEIAATLVMLAGVGLLGQSFLKLISVSPGFRGQDLVVLKVSRSPLEATFAAPSQRQIARQTQFLRDALARVRAIPGVRSAAVTGGLPIADPDGFPDGEFLILNGHATGEADYAVASAEFFRTLGIPLIRGRLFNAHDGPDAPNVAVISETLAREQWPNQNPIDQVIDFSNMDGIMKPLTIVGVVGNIRAEGLNQPPSPIIYVDYRQRGLALNTSPAIILRTALPARAIAPAARDVFHDLNPDVPVQFSTFREALGGWMAERRFLLLLSGLFAAAALALATIGIYGLVAHSVARRTQEIGIRIALGAQRRDVLRLVLGEGARLTAIGVGIGVAVSFAAMRLISSLLFEVKAIDPLTLLVVAMLLSVVAMLASYIPARRATKVDPMIALRYE